MKKLYSILAILLLTAGGCSLIPKNVEFGQKKVKAVPTFSASQGQRQKQAAAMAAEKAQETKEAALATAADPSVLVPAAETAVLTDALSTSLGPPEKPSTKTPEELATTLEKEKAAVDSKVQKYRERTQEMVGKAVEGTGVVQMSYFTYVGCILGLVFLIYAGLKIYGLVCPPVGMGLGVVERVTSKVAASAFSSTAHGLEAFKDELQEGAQYTKAQVKQMLATNLQKKQDSDVQDLAYRLTRK